MGTVNEKVSESDFVPLWDGTVIRRAEIAFGLILYRVPCQCRVLTWPFIVINRKLCLSASRR